MRTRWPGAANVLWLNGWSGYEEETPVAERGPRLLAAGCADRRPTAVRSRRCESAVTDLEVDERPPVRREPVSTACTRSTPPQAPIRAGIVAARRRSHGGWTLDSGAVYVVTAASDSPHDQEGPTWSGYRASDGAMLPQAFRHSSTKPPSMVAATDDTLFAVCECRGTRISNLQAYDRDNGHLRSTSASSGDDRAHGRLAAGACMSPVGTDGYEGVSTWRRLGERVRAAAGRDGLASRARSRSRRDGTVAIGGTNGAINGADADQPRGVQPVDRRAAAAI